MYKLINQLKYDEKINTITDNDNENVVTHCFGIDFIYYIHMHVVLRFLSIYVQFD